jgi:hypothetical protein
MSTTDNSPLLVASPQAEPTAELDDAMGREQRCSNCGVIKAITIVIDLLVARRALDQAQFLRLLDAHIAVLQQTADPPGVNPSADAAADAGTLRAGKSRRPSISMN